MITCIKDDLRRVYVLRMGALTCEVTYALSDANAEVNRCLYHLICQMSWNPLGRWECEANDIETCFFFNLGLEVERHLAQQPKTKRLLAGSVLA